MKHTWTATKYIEVDHRRKWGIDQWIVVKFHRRPVKRRKLEVAK